MRTKKILVIDYDQSSLASLQSVFADEGYEVLTASDGQTGWDRYNKEAPDLVLLEAMLPKVHGFELCQKITSERNSQTTVFIMTGVYKDRIYRTEALRTYGASGYFEKPLKMDELVASVEAVLGKAEPKPAVAETAPAKPAPAAKPKPVLVEPRRVERPKAPDDNVFALPADLDEMSRDVPKVKVPAASPHGPSLEARFETLADELLKSVVLPDEHKAQPEKPQAEKGHGGNGHEAVDVDQILKSALADFDLKHEKVKVPKTAPLPPPPAPEKPKVEAPPVAAKPKPLTPPPAPKPPATPPPAPARPLTHQAPERPKPVATPLPVEKVKVVAPTPPPVTPSPPPPVFVKPPAPAPSGTITPGDPGSDVTPFVTPEHLKPEKPKEIYHAPVPPQVKPLEKPKVQAPAPALPAPPAPKPAPVEARIPKAQAAVPILETPVSFTRARDAEERPATPIFSDSVARRPRKGFSPFIAVGAGAAVLAVAGFFILRPHKPAASSDNGLKSSQAAVQQPLVENKAVGETPPQPKPKPANPRPKVETQTRVANIGPSIEEAILVPTAPMSTAPALEKPGGPEGTANQATGDPSAGQAANPTAANAQSSAAPATAGDPPDGGVAIVPAATPSAAPAKEGDLVELSVVDEQPKTLKTVDPVYPTSAQRLGVEGSVTVNALIDERGNVIDTGILKGFKDDKGLLKAAESAVRKWRFQPARKDGVNVKVWKPFVIVFKTEKKSPNMLK